jgi:ATP-dependent 26S proteasome regulatory subunit
MQMTLCPAQQRACDGLLAVLPIGNLFTLIGDTGMGKTAILREVYRAVGGAFLTAKAFVDAMRSQDPFALEETFERFVGDALTAHEYVLVDDLHLVANVVNGYCGAYPRSGWLNAPLTALANQAIETGRKLIFACQSHAPSPIYQRSYDTVVKEFEPEDYAWLCRAYLGAEIADRLDYAKVHRFAPRLDAHLLKAVCRRVTDDMRLDTEQFVDLLRTFGMVSNVNLTEVQTVSLDDLVGVDDVLTSLEANIIVPLEHDALAVELSLKPKRGVLLAGPPGTGKTTVGRALAHRLKSKFFLVDGTCISGTGHFYGQIHQIFEAAKQNAPAIIFIDDSDVIFESGEELGLYRYLLTMLDGLESASVGRVCVMMTAMDVANLPPALIRSGRVELWLEMRLPDANARLKLLRRQLASLPRMLGDPDLPRVSEATEGFTGADLKRLVEDAKTLLAYDRVRSVAARPLTEYFLEAAAAVRANKERYAAAEARARLQRPARPVYFDPLGSNA